MKRALSCVLVSGATVLLFACEPEVFSNAYTPEPASFISGIVRLDDGSDEPGGPAVLFRFDCDDPPPPTGSAYPVDFVVVPEASFDGGAASFVFPFVPANSCHILSGFVDRDRDFHYAYSVTSQASANDLSLTATVVEIGEAAEGSEWIEPAEAVILRGETSIPLDRPAFEPTGIQSSAAAAPRLYLDPAGHPLGDAMFRLRSHEVRSDLVDVDAPVFTVVFAPDGDEDGLPDDLNGDTLPDILWPRVVIRRLDPTDASSQNLAVPSVHLAAVVLPLNPMDPEDQDSALLSQLLSSGLPLDGASMFLATQLTVLVPGLVVTSLEPVELSPMSELASTGAEVTGRYQLLVMNSTGQSWSLPNELSQYNDENQGLPMLVEIGEPSEERSLVAQ